jgi:hypothetical protein
MLKIPEKYDTNTLPAKFKDISRLIHAWLLGVSAATRQLWCINQGSLELGWELTTSEISHSERDVLYDTSL